MIEMIPATLALLAGVPIGIMFFGALWWTVQRVMSFRQPSLLVAASLLLRTIVALAAFYLIGRGSWQRLVACLIGFMFARVLIARFSQVHLATDRRLLKEGAR